MRLPLGMKDALEKAARDDGRSLTSLAIWILRLWLVERGYLPEAGEKERKR